MIFIYFLQPLHLFSVLVFLILRFMHVAYSRFTSQFAQCHMMVLVFIMIVSTFQTWKYWIIVGRVSCHTIFVVSLCYRRPGEDSDNDYFRDSSSDGSSDSEQERCLNLREQHNHHRQMSEIPRRLDGLSLREHATIQEGFSSDEGESGNAQGCLMFEYLERDQPYGRVPLADKASFFIRNSIHAVPILISLFNSFLYFLQQILDLALRFPKLKTLRSCDLLSCSWISVAWYNTVIPIFASKQTRAQNADVTYRSLWYCCRYPIYRIPVGPTLEDLNACFLTFHSLNTPASGNWYFCCQLIDSIILYVICLCMLLFGSSAFCINLLVFCFLVFEWLYLLESGYMCVYVLFSLMPMSLTFSQFWTHIFIFDAWDSHYS